MLQPQKPLTRYTAKPTKFDISPYGTLCVVVKNDECTESDYYIQASKDQDDPNWMSAQDLLFDVYKDKLQNPEFISSLLYCRDN